MSPIFVPNRKLTLIDRREILRLGALGLAGLAGLGKPGVALSDCFQTQGATEGPFWVDEKLLRSDIRPDPSTGTVQPGVPLRLTLNVSEVNGGACSPVPGAYVDIWHCSALGAYSDVSGAGNPNNVGQKWLRGSQVTDNHGNVQFTTIYPGWYRGRTVHIHYRVRKYSGATVTHNFVSQLYFEDAISDAIFAEVAPYTTNTGRSPASNLQDNIYLPGGLLRMAWNGDHVVASFNTVINAEVGRNHPRATPSDADSLEHLLDFGGGSPRIFVA